MISLQSYLPTTIKSKQTCLSNALCVSGSYSVFVNVWLNSVGEIRHLDFDD